MAGTDLKLIGAWTSPFVMRVRVALNIKSLNYEYLEETSITAKSELLLKSNPIHKKIPVLIHGDNPICESLIIVEYIDEVWSSSPLILPAHPYDRATARFWVDFIDNKLFLSIKAITLVEDGHENKAAIAQIEEGMVLLEEALEKISKGKAFFGGEQIGFLDIALGSILGWLRITEKFIGFKVLDEIRTPALFEWVERFSSDGFVKGLAIDTEMLAGFAKMLQKMTW